MTEKDDIDTQTLKKMSREQLLEVSTRMITDIEQRVRGDRFRVREGDETKLKFLRVLVSAIQAHSSILKDDDLEDIKRRLEHIEAAQGGQI
ncbi:hypothetical protein [Methanolobus sp.]|uniref:hypothetical protein n=1 Tax=Methanolobus sp. TaxID=1874737 RepID=UPI0025F8CF06|nr:hypothetical protein [Methanolobus sp.]